MKFKLFFIVCFATLTTAVNAEKKSFSGIYPHLAYYNKEGECGTGAVVPWADRLWVVTYAPHKPFGSSDKLYEITPDLEITTRKESIGGTPANRLIHNESQQLFIASYAIDKQGAIRTIPFSVMPGRMTGSARHLTDPENKLYTATMEEGFYEIDVNTLAVNTLFEDNNQLVSGRMRVNTKPQLLAGAHGKGLYSGQGVLIYTNNGDTSEKALTDFDAPSGALAEWDGKEWKLIRRNQFVEITGPGGIYGNKNPKTDPLWATGWDNKSILLGVRDSEHGWSFYRLPKASHSYDGAHGWNTEWPRIRNIGTEKSPRYLMTMHGMFWDFPSTFTSGNSCGIRPRSAYLKVIGDFTRWQEQLVFGCDDAAQKEFLNVRKIKGRIAGPGQSNSNLWFTSLSKPDELGPSNASGAVWLNERVLPNRVSEPFLFNGWESKVLWVKSDLSKPLEIIIEIDRKGNNKWEVMRTITVPANGNLYSPFLKEERGEWVRLRTSQEATVSAMFLYANPEKRKTTPNPIFQGISTVDQKNSIGGLLYSLGNNRRKLGILSGSFNKSQFNINGYYELDENMNLKKSNNTKEADFIRNNVAIPKQSVVLDQGSVLIVDDQNRRWRLPLGPQDYTALTDSGALRICREVATERDLLNVAGTFYELPAENADGFAKIRPIASHNFRIHDFVSYRGMLVLTGLDPKIKNPQIIRSDDGKAMVWAGVIDDLWSLGKPVGGGGPWIKSMVESGIASDPYLIGFYDQRTLQISHQSDSDVTFTIEVNPMGHGPWITYKRICISKGKSFNYKFPDTFQARWIRFIADKNTIATTYLEYK